MRIRWRRLPAMGWSALALVALFLLGETALAQTEVETGPDSQEFVDGGDDSRSDDPLVVVVGPDSPIRALEMATLRLAYLGELADLHELVMGAGSGGGAPITLLIYAPVEQRFLRVVAHRTYVQYRRYWTRRALAGDSALAPVRVHYLHELRMRLVRDRRALGFLLYSEAMGLSDHGIRVLPLDGLGPGDLEYPLP
jgi:hypothetical protein